MRTAARTSEASPVPAMPTTTAQRAGWALRDTAALAGRDLTHWARQPAPVVIGLLFPVLILLMFGYLLGGGIVVAGGGDYREFLVPGILAMTVLFGLETTIVAVSTDAARGVTDRFRSMPVTPGAVVAARNVTDLLSSVVGLAVMVAAGLLVGWQWREGTLKALLAFALLLLLLLLRFALLWVGIWIGLVVNGPESVVAVQILVWPVGFLSNAFVSTETMPGWVAAITRWNPLSSTVYATRGLFGNPGAADDSWIAGHSILMAVGWPVLLIAVFMPLAVRRYQRLGR